MTDNEILRLFHKYAVEGTREEDIVRDYFLHGELRRVEKKDVRTIALYYASIKQGGGVRRTMSLLIPLYIKWGYKVVLITEEAPSDEDYMIPADVKRYTVVSTGDIIAKRVDYEERGKQLADIFAKEGIDVFCSHNSLYPLLFFDLVLAHSLNVYFIIVNHQVYTQELIRFENYYFKYKYIFMLADKLIVLSSYEKQYWNALGISAEYIANPVTYDKNWIKRVNAEDIVWVGRFDRDTKNFLDVVPIMKEVHKRFPKLKLRMYGESNVYNHYCLQMKIVENGLTQNIEYCGQTKDLNQIYGQARIHLVTSASETFPMGIYEGKMYGIPLVAYELPSVEILRDGKGVITVPQRNTKQAAEAIIAILSDHELEKKLQREAEESADCIDAGSIEKKWKDVFQNLPYSQEKQGAQQSISGDTFQVILETIFAHYCGCVTKHNEIKEWCKKCWKKMWLSEVKYRTYKDNLQIAIYPYGKVGKEVKKILNENDIWESMVVDNYSAGEGIVKLEDLEGIDTGKYLFLICSSAMDAYTEIREELARYVCPENTYDLYSEEMLVNQPFSLFSD